MDVKCCILYLALATVICSDQAFGRRRQIRQSAEQALDRSKIQERVETAKARYQEAKQNARDGASSAVDNLKQRLETRARAHFQKAPSGRLGAPQEDEQSLTSKLERQSKKLQGIIDKFEAQLEQAVQTAISLKSVATEEKSQVSALQTQINDFQARVDELEQPLESPAEQS